MNVCTRTDEGQRDPLLPALHGAQWQDDVLCVRVCIDIHRYVDTPTSICVRLSMDMCTYPPKRPTRSSPAHSCTPTSYPPTHTLPYPVLHPRVTPYPL